MSLRIAMLGYKRIPSREGGVEVVVEELATRMAGLGHNETCAEILNCCSHFIRLE